MSEFADILRPAVAALANDEPALERLYEGARRTLTETTLELEPNATVERVAERRMELERAIETVEAERGVAQIRAASNVSQEDAERQYAADRDRERWSALGTRNSLPFTQGEYEALSKSLGTAADEERSVWSRELFRQGMTRALTKAEFKALTDALVSTPANVNGWTTSQVFNFGNPSDTPGVARSTKDAPVGITSEELAELVDDIAISVSVSEPSEAAPTPTQEAIRTRVVRVIAPPADAAAPPQRPDATGFKATADGLDVGPIQVYEKLLVTPDQQEAYEALRHEAGEVLAFGTNFLGDAAAGVRRLVQALPQSMAEARLFTVWQAGNRLRRLYSAHGAVAGQSERHPASLDPAVAEMIGALCDEFNNFAAVDPGLRQRDAWRLPPTQRPSTVTEEFDAIEPVVNQAIEAHIVTPEAAAEVQAEIPAELLTAPEVVIPEIDLANRTRRNFVAALIDGAFETAKTIAKGGKVEVAHATRQIADGFYGNIGAGAGISMVMVVISNSAALQRFAAEVLNSPQAVSAIEWMVKIFGP